MNSSDNSQSDNSNIEESVKEQINITESDAQMNATFNTDMLFSQMFVQRILTQSTKVDPTFDVESGYQKSPSWTVLLPPEVISTASSVFDCDETIHHKNESTVEEIRSESNINCTTAITQTSTENHHSSYDALNVVENTNESTVIYLSDDDTLNRELKESVTSENVSTLNGISTACTTSEVFSGTEETNKTTVISLLDDTLNKEMCQTKIFENENNQHEATDTKTSTSIEKLNKSIITILDNTLDGSLLNLGDQVKSAKIESLENNIDVDNEHMNTNLKMESYVDALFSSALSSSVLEKCSESASAPIRAQDNKTDCEDTDILNRPQRESSLAEQLDGLAQEGHTLPKLRLKRAALLDNASYYSPARSDLAAAFENLKINSTTDETFSSCNNELEISESENHGEEDLSSDIEFTVKNKVPEIETSKNCDEIIKDVTAGGTVAENPTNNISETCSQTEPEDGIIIVTDADCENHANIGSEDVSTSSKTKRRRTSSYYISDTPSVPSPSPFQEKLSHLDNELYNELLTASPSVLKEKLPQFQKYTSLKLDINSLQQTIAKLIMEVKLKEGEIIKLRPNNVKSRPTVNLRKNLQETIKASDEAPEQQNKILLLNEEIKELYDKLHKKDTELEEVARENSNLKEMLLSKEAELQCSKEANAKLEKTMINFENIVTITQKKLAEAQTTIKNLEKDNSAQNKAFNQVLEKYEKCKQITLAMNSNEEIFKDRIKYLEGAYKVLKAKKT